MTAPLTTELVNTPRLAEAMAMKAMRSWGFTDAKLGPLGRDGGIDIRSEMAMAQVKFQNSLTDVKMIRELIGACAIYSRPKLLFFFSVTGYTVPAFNCANSGSVALFTYNVVGEIAPSNHFAEPYLEDSGGQSLRWAPAQFLPFSI